MALSPRVNCPKAEPVGFSRSPTLQKRQHLLNADKSNAIPSLIDNSYMQCHATFIPLLPSRHTQATIPAQTRPQREPAGA